MNYAKVPHPVKHLSVKDMLTELPSFRFITNKNK